MKRHVLIWKPFARCIAVAGVALPLLLARAENLPPVIDDPLLFPDGITKKVDPKIPIGKTLMIPIAATDADGDPLSYRVSSTNPNIMARIRTGRPHLKVEVDYAGNTEADASDKPFTGELDFQLFRDWTPETAGFIGGFAQSFFYSPAISGTTTKYTIFHRVIKDFIVQTGDPNGQFPDPSATTEGGTIPDALVRGPGFTFDDEFGVPMIFTGRGQLAMANAGYTSTYQGTNGSQFFITTGSPRHLDFNHTIFGQLVRGWDVLEKIQNVPVKEQFVNPRDPTAVLEVSRPKTDIKITDTKVEPNFTDALLVLSAIGTGTSTITVTASDGKGGETPKQFNVSAVKDDHNSPPFFSKVLRDRAIEKNKPIVVSLQAEDLEQDFLTYVNGLIDSTTNGRAQQSGNQIAITPNSGYEGPLTLAYGVVQYDMASTVGRGYDELRSVSLAVGEKDVIAEPLQVIGSAGVALVNAPLARYVDTDPRGTAGSISASINWGDGTPISSSVLSHDTSRPVLAGFRVNGSHSYARTGVYPVEVTLTSTAGLNRVIHSAAIITDKSLHLIPQQYKIPSRSLSGRKLADIIDTEPGGTAADYEATLDWGDGVLTSGLISSSGSGALSVAGTHSYTDPDSYSVAIRVHRKGTAASADAFTWATLDMNFPVVAPFLPPFPMAHLVAGISSVVDTKNTATQSDDVDKPFRTTTGNGVDSQTTLTFSLSLINSGNKRSNPSKVRFYLSADRTLNLQDVPYTDSSGETPVQRINPKDIPLTIGGTEKALPIIALKAGQGGALSFDRAGGRDTRIYLPKGETGIGYNLLVSFDYDDELAKLSPIDREAIKEVQPPFSPNPAAISVTEVPEGSKHTASYKIHFDRRPTSAVTIPLSIVNSGGNPETSEFYFTAALPVPPADNPALSPDKNLTSSPGYSVTFTPEQWDQGQRDITVTVAGKQDDIRDGDQTNYVQMGPASSLDARFHGKYVASESVTTLDFASLFTTSVVALTTTELAGSFHTRSFTVTLKQRPTAEVVLPVVNTDPSEGVVTATKGATEQALFTRDGKPSLVFSETETYPAQRTVTVTAIDDFEADGLITYTIEIGPATSADKDFDGANPPDVSVSNVDNPPAPAAAETSSTQNQ